MPARPPLPLWAAVLVAVGGGFVYDLAFPGAAIWPLAFLGIALLLIALIGRSAWGALLVGYVFGVSFYLNLVSWTSLYLGPVPWLALSLLESAFVAVGALAITLAYRWWPSSRRWPRLLLLPLLIAGLWIARETATGTIPYGGFPWGRAAHTQAEGPLAELVSLVGMSGLGFAMVALAAMGVEWARTTPWRRFRPARDLSALAPGIGLLAVAVLVPAWPTAPAGELTVASVQGNGPAGYFDERQRGDLLRAQHEATAPILGTPGVDVLLWPEGSSEFDPSHNEQVAEIFDEMSASFGGIPIVFNTVTADGDRLYNTSLAWQLGRGEFARYHKRNPVPFGEYVPDRPFYESLAPDLIGLIQREYTPGTTPPVFDLDGVAAGLAICFDVIYDGLIWEGAELGAEVYLFQTNNADFRGTDENQQQLAIARLRAIETGRSVVNISTVGTSQVIDPAGRTIDALPAYRAGSMITDVELRTGLTPAVALGAWVPGLITAGALLALSTLGALSGVRRRAGDGRGAPAADAD